MSVFQVFLIFLFMYVLYHELSIQMDNMLTDLTQINVAHFFTQAYTRAGSRLAPSQWETALFCNAVSHWLGTNLESALLYHFQKYHGKPAKSIRDLMFCVNCVIWLRLAVCLGTLGLVSIQRLSFLGVAIPITKIRWLRNCLIFMIGILIQVKWHLDTEAAAWSVPVHVYS